MFNLIASTLLVVIGLMSVVTYNAVGDKVQAQEQLEKAKADARTAWGKVHDMQEGRDEALEQAHSAHSIGLWALQAKLNACEAAKDKKP